MSEKTWYDIPGEVYPARFLDNKSLNSFRQVNHRCRLEANIEASSRIRKIYDNPQINQQFIFLISSDKSFKSVKFLNKLIIPEVGTLSDNKKLHYFSDIFGLDHIDMICYYNGQTVMINDELYPFGNFELYITKWNFKGKDYHLIKGNVEHDQSMSLYPKLNSNYQYQMYEAIFPPIEEALRSNINYFLEHNLNDKLYIDLSIYNKHSNSNYEESITDFILNIFNNPIVGRINKFLLTVLSYGLKNNFMITANTINENMYFDIIRYYQNKVTLSIYKYNVLSSEFVEIEKTLGLSTKEIMNKNSNHELLSYITNLDNAQKYMKQTLDHTLYYERINDNEQFNATYISIDPTIENIDIIGIFTLTDIIAVTDMQIIHRRIDDNHIYTQSIALLDGLFQIIVYDIFNINYNALLNSTVIDWYDNLDVNLINLKEMIKPLTGQKYKYIPTKMVIVEYYKNGIIKTIIKLNENSVKDLNKQILDKNINISLPIGDIIYIFSKSGKQLYTPLQYKERYGKFDCRSYDRYLREYDK